MPRRLSNRSHPPNPQGRVLSLRNRLQPRKTHLKSLQETTKVFVFLDGGSIEYPFVSSSSILMECSDYDNVEMSNLYEAV